MPLPIMLAHQLVARQRRAAARRASSSSCAPTPSRQVTVEYDGDRPLRIDAVVLSTQHAPDIAYETLEVEGDRRDRAARAAQAPAGRRHAHLREPDRPLRGRRTAGRRRPHRPQDHRRHLRRHGPPRRRRVLGQGSVEGRPLARRTPRARSPRTSSPPGSRRPLRGAGRLRDRRRRAGLGPVDTFGTGQRRRRAHRARDAQALRPDARAGSSTRSTCCARSTAQTAFHGHFGRTGDAFTWEKTNLADDLRRDLGLVSSERGRT